MFIDQAIIEVRAGKGGDGCVSLRREKYVPKGGPDGGDGGHGGSVVLFADDNANTLLGFRGRRHWHADNGRPGEGSDRTGASADDLLLPVPPGTLVYDDNSGQLMIDIDAPGMRHVIARGGRGGYGNAHFKSATNQTPRYATPGEPGQEYRLRLELKLLADIGLIGKPNAGKSTLLATISSARPTVADFPFTTLHPQLGIAELDPQRRLVFADIPGLIEGASRGAGLGHAFLRHVERTRALVHLLDVMPLDGTDPVENHRTIRAELAAHSSKLAEKQELIVLNKIDLVAADERTEMVEHLSHELANGADANDGDGTLEIIAMSGATGLGVPAFLEACWRLSGHVAERW